jgi:Heparinase II/III-like protein
MSSHLVRTVYNSVLACVIMISICSIQALQARHPVPRQHPMLLGTAQQLKEKARQRESDWVRVKEVVQQRQGGPQERMIGMSLMYVIDGNEARGQQAVELALRVINRPIRVGHTRFGGDLARCAIVFDLCYPLWKTEDRKKYIEYYNATVDANVRSETSPFHNGWYSYKNWGVGMGAYATYYENERAPQILADMEKDYVERVLPAFKLAGEGGGWAEGHYGNYWMYEWMFFCDVALRVAGVNFVEMGKDHLGQKAIASMFEMYPGIEDFHSRRAIPMGDGNGKIPGNDRDKTLSGRRMLVNFMRDDPDHQVVHTFNEITPKSCMVVNAYKDFLWRDRTVQKGDLKNFKLSHFSPGPGYVYARSSWEDDATYFFFKSSDRFTAHQHLDNGHFLIYKHEELAADGGEYDLWNSSHEVNYLVRTIAHNTILVKDPEETWQQIRVGALVDGNDGGQHYSWPHHNGRVEDAAAWQAGREMYELADMKAFEDKGEYLYLASDCSKSYSQKKLDCFTRQIVYLRPGTFVIFDRVHSTNKAYEKTWSLQAAKTPEKQGSSLVVTNGKGRLFVQTVLPEQSLVKLNHGDKLYSYDGKDYPPEMQFGPLPECRVGISPAKASKEDVFLHVLTATDHTVNQVPLATHITDGRKIVVQVGDVAVEFRTDKVAGGITIDGRYNQFGGVLEKK